MENTTYSSWNGVIFSPEKFHFAENEVEFAGLLKTTGGMKPTKKMTGPSSFSYTLEYHRSQILVWIWISSLICIHARRSDGSVSRTEYSIGNKTLEHLCEKSKRTDVPIQQNNIHDNIQKVIQTSVTIYLGNITTIWAKQALVVVMAIESSLRTDPAFRIDAELCHAIVEREAFVLVYCRLKILEILFWVGEFRTHQPKIIIKWALKLIWKSLI